MCTSTILIAVKHDITAMTVPIMTAPASPDFPTAQGIDNNDVPIIVFQIDKLQQSRELKKQPVLQRMLCSAYIVTKLLHFPSPVSSAAPLSLSRFPNPGSTTVKNDAGNTWSGRLKGGNGLEHPIHILPPSHSFGHMPWANFYEGHVTKDMR